MNTKQSPTIGHDTADIEGGGGNVVAHHAGHRHEDVLNPLLLTGGGLVNVGGKLAGERRDGGQQYRFFCIEQAHLEVIGEVWVEISPLSRVVDLKCQHATGTRVSAYLVEIWDGLVNSGPILLDNVTSLTAVLLLGNLRGKRLRLNPQVTQKK